MHPYPRQAAITTEQVRFGADNELVVRVKNNFNFGGIFRRCFVYAPRPEVGRQFRRFQWQISRPCGNAPKRILTGFWTPTSRSAILG